MLRSRILDRYITRELLAPFFLSIAVLTLALFLQKTFRLVDLLLAKGTSAGAAAKLLLYLMPGFLMLTIPISLLVAALTAFSRLSADSEITAMKASRVSLYAMIRPVLRFAFILFAVTAVFANFIAPRANYALKVHLFSLVKSRAMMGLDAGVFSSTFDGMVIYVDHMDSLDRLNGVFISDERSPSDSYAIIAQRGSLSSDPASLNVTLRLENGSVHLQPRGEATYSLMSFDRAKLNLDINQMLVRRKSDDGRDVDESDTVQLYQVIAKARKAGQPTQSQEIEIQKRLSVSYACLIFGLIGAPLGIRHTRSGKSAGIAIAIGVILIYYFILGTGANLAESGKLTPAAAYWIPNLLITGATALLIVKRGQEIHLGVGARIARLALRLVSFARRKRDA